MKTVLTKVTKLLSLALLVSSLFIFYQNARKSANFEIDDYTVSDETLAITVTVQFTPTNLIALPEITY